MASSDEVRPTATMMAYMRAQIPLTLRGPVLKMCQSAATLSETIPTIILGIVDGTTYTDEMWRRDVGRLIRLFSCDSSSIAEMKIPPQEENSRVINADVLEENMENALQFLTQHNVVFLRIATIGVGSSQAMFDALKSLFQGWNQNRENKNVQFVAYADSDDCDMFNFCKRICLTGVCNSMEFINLMDYNNYGYLDENHMTFGAKSLTKMMREMGSTGMGDMLRTMMAARHEQQN